MDDNQRRDDGMTQRREPPSVLIGFWDENEIREAGLKTVYPKVK